MQTSKKYKIRKGDEVVVLTGRSKGATGKVDRINAKKDQVYVAGVNIYKKHQKAGQGNTESAIIDKVMPMHISNVAIVDPKTKKASRVGYQVVDGKKNRISKASGSVLSHI